MSDVECGDVSGFDDRYHPVTRFDQRDEQDVNELLELAAMNRPAPVPSDAVDRVRAELASLRNEVGATAFSDTLAAALLEAGRDRTLRELS